MQTLETIEGILYHIGYKKWISHRFNIGRTTTGFWLQFAQQIPDCTGDTDYISEWQNGRKWMISRHMCCSEIVMTAFKAVATFEEHEARECFTYKKAAIFGPHIDVEALVDVSYLKDTRAKPSTGRALSEMTFGNIEGDELQPGEKTDAAMIDNALSPWNNVKVKS